MTVKHADRPIWSKRKGSPSSFQAEGFSLKLALGLKGTGPGLPHIANGRYTADR